MNTVNSLYKNWFAKDGKFSESQDSFQMIDFWFCGTELLTAVARGTDQQSVDCSWTVLQGKSRSCSKLGLVLKMHLPMESFPNKWILTCTGINSCMSGT